MLPSSGLASARAAVYSLCFALEYLLHVGAFIFCEFFAALEKMASQNENMSSCAGLPVRETAGSAFMALRLGHLKLY